MAKFREMRKLWARTVITTRDWVYFTKEAKLDLKYLLKQATAV